MSEIFGIIMWKGKSGRLTTSRKAGYTPAFYGCYVSLQSSIVWFQKISIPPLHKGRREVNLPNIPVGGGVHHREIFPEDSRDA